MKAKPRKILVALYIAYGSGREILYGIDRYARAHCNWRLRVVDCTGNKAVDDIRRAETDGFDGIIACGLDHPATAECLQASRTPLVCVC